MTNPLSFVPYAIGAANGRVGEHQAAALVAAGLTLLQRSAPLVRAFSGQSPAILLPHGAAFVTALSACDGYAALLLDATGDACRIRASLAMAGSSVVFTGAALAHLVPVERVTVLLDGVPQEAHVRVPGSAGRRVDLGSHVGLALEGERDAEGSDEPVLRWIEEEQLRQLSHREIMASATYGSRLPDVLTHGGSARNVVERLLHPLLRGESC